MSRSTAAFKSRFEAALEAMADKGVFDDRAERVINQHFLGGSKEPFGIERARHIVVNGLMDEFLDLGWSLFDYDSTGLMQVQRDDEAEIFDSDADAVAYVRERAENGSAHHAKALADHLRDAQRIATMEASRV